MRLTLEEYRRIREFIYRKTGLFFDDRKLLFVKKRLEQRIAVTGAMDCLDYLRDLQYRDAEGFELQALLNCLTTNETYFFREFEQLAAFGEHCLTEICEKKEASGYRDLRIWCAGCSSGEEAYTLAIILREMIEDPEDWRITLLATDINSRVMDMALRGAYEKRAVKDVPPAYLERWFTRRANNGTGEDQYHIHTKIKNMCTFELLNLKNIPNSKQFSGLDFIFCRNVLIYFDDESRSNAVSHFYDCLNPGGYIFLGHSESINRISSAFTLRRKGGFLVYQKPLTGQKPLMGQKP